MDLSDIENQAKETLKKNRVAIFLVAYNAEKHISKVLERIPGWVAQGVAEIYVIDDCSKDQTVATARAIEWPENFAPLKIYRTPYNQGYGGNQRLGYLYAIEKKFDIVVLLHADGQYAPEALPDILAPYNSGADAVFGSRFINSLDALKGKMPLYKWIGNQILTRLQNLLLHSQMSEMHSGYRSYRVSALKKVPFIYNSLNFDFDADIIIQFLAQKLKIIEVPIPTFYGSEICHVNGMQYAWNCLKTAVKYRLMKFEIFYDPKFDFKSEAPISYQIKKAGTTLHHFIRTQIFKKNAAILELSGKLDDQDSSIYSRASSADPSLLTRFSVDSDLDSLEKLEISQDVILALDILEHMTSPEQAAQVLFKNLKSGGRLFASTANVAFFPMRLMLLLGHFNYSRRGILDLTHHRLFTASSFRRFLTNAGFRVDQIIGFGPPVKDAFPNSTLMGFLDRALYSLAGRWPQFFAFQVLMVCTRTDAVEDLMKEAFVQEAEPEFPLKELTTL